MIVKIMPGLYVGSAPRVKDIPQLRELGITSIASVYGQNTSSGVVWGLDAQYAHYPLSDGKYPGSGNLIMAAEGVRALPRPVLVHCRQGRNRSMAVALLILGWERGWGSEQVITWGEKVRPRALANPAYRVLLKELLG